MSDTPIPDREARLPAWARNELRNLRADVARLGADASATTEYTVETAPPDALYLRMPRFGPASFSKPNLRPLPKFASVTYIDDDGVPVEIDTSFVHRDKDGRATSGGLSLRGTDGLTIWPVVANNIHVLSQSSAPRSWRLKARARLDAATKEPA